MEGQNRDIVTKEQAAEIRSKFHQLWWNMDFEGFEQMLYNGPNDRETEYHIGINYIHEFGYEALRDHLRQMKNEQQLEVVQKMAACPTLMGIAERLSNDLPEYDEPWTDDENFE